MTETTPPADVVEAAHTIMKWIEANRIHGLRILELQYNRSGALHHCPTCQCNKLHPTVPAPDNPRSRSWHENADHAPPK